MLTTIETETKITTTKTTDKAAIRIITTDKAVIIIITGGIVVVITDIKSKKHTKDHVPILYNSHPHLYLH